MGPFFPNGLKLGIKARLSWHFSDKSPAPPYSSMLDSQKQLSAPNSLLTIDESNRDIHGQRSTGRDLDRSETLIQHLPMGDIGGHAKIVLTVDMYGAGGPPSACDDNQLPHLSGALKVFTDRHRAARRTVASSGIELIHALPPVGCCEGALAPLSSCRQKPDRKSVRPFYHGQIHRV